MVRIKICGITNPEDALCCAESGADAIGFVFYEKSSRYIEPERVSRIVSGLPPFLTTVGVFVNESTERIMEVKAISGVDIVQLHGDETPAFCDSIVSRHIKSIRVRDKAEIDTMHDYTTNLILLDSFSGDEYGGTGNVFDWEFLKGYNFGTKKIILSGGLNSDNVAHAVKYITPWAVDVSSGVERSLGLKDHTKIKNFIEAIKNEDGNENP